jgi:hypothetical protein
MEDRFSKLIWRLLFFERVSNSNAILFDPEDRDVIIMDQEEDGLWYPLRLPNSNGREDGYLGDKMMSIACRVACWIAYQIKVPHNKY